MLGEDETIEMYERRIADNAGMVDYIHFVNFCYHAAQGLIMFGGSFAKALGYTLAYADDANKLKIIRVWPNECTQHEMLYRIHLAKLKAKEEEHVRNSEAS